jgi:(p)ppGpp synthase/HD superfamily hydrolase
VGHRCIGARVNGRAVPLRYHLQNGDVVEIVTSKRHEPRDEWLEIVVTGRARTRIRQRLRELGELDPLDGQIRRHTAEAPPEGKEPPPPVAISTRKKLIRVTSANGATIAFAKCCNPMPGQSVLGYQTHPSRITIHRADCRNFMAVARDPERMMDACWEGDRGIEIGLRVVTGQRPNVLADITNAIRPMNINMLHAHFKAGDNGHSVLEFVFEVPDSATVERISATLRTVSGVREVEPVESVMVYAD